MILRPCPISSDRFTFDPVENLFTAEASDLLDRPFGRVYDDAMDEGFTLVSARSGREVVYGFAREARDGENDLLFTDYRPVPNQRGTADVTARVRIFND